MKTCIGVVQIIEKTLALGFKLNLEIPFVHLRIFLFSDSMSRLSPNIMYVLFANAL